MHINLRFSCLEDCFQSGQTPLLITFVMVVVKIPLLTLRVLSLPNPERSDLLAALLLHLAAIAASLLFPSTVVSSDLPASVYETLLSRTVDHLVVWAT